MFCSITFYSISQARQNAGFIDDKQQVLEALKAQSSKEHYVNTPFFNDDSSFPLASSLSKPST